VAIKEHPAFGEMTAELWAALQGILIILGYDTKDPHFRRTPQRMTSWLADFRKNADDRGADKLMEVVFPEEVPDSLVIVGPTEYRSVCAHHMLPVNGRAWVGYLPNEGICGLSKLSRLVSFYSEQLTVQERVTNQIADALMRTLKPKGCMVVIEAEHMCMSYRGIRDRDVSTTTSAVRGIHRDSAAARAEFLSLMRNH
jgi:GTP cyclohydrolase IA